MKTIHAFDDNGEAYPTHKIAEEFTNEFINETLGLPITLVATQLGLALCSLIAELRGEDLSDDRFYADDDDSECTDPNCTYPH